jgi:hypothetical protein
MVFFPVYAGQFGGLSEARALQATTVAQALALVIVPLAGLANDGSTSMATSVSSARDLGGTLHDERSSTVDGSIVGSL